MFVSSVCGARSAYVAFNQRAACGPVSGIPAFAVGVIGARKSESNHSDHEGTSFDLWVGSNEDQW
jgi:hypothetical protein